MSIRDVIQLIAAKVGFYEITKHPEYGALAIQMRTVVGATPLDMFIQGESREDIVDLAFKTINHLKDKRQGLVQSISDVLNNRPTMSRAERRRQQYFEQVEEKDGQIPA